MSTIGTLNTNDNGSVSRTTINTNFTNLNADKIEGVNSGGPTNLTGIIKGSGSVLSAVSAPTGTIVGTSDTQTLTNKDISNANNTYRASSLTQTGVVELATTAEINTGTDTTRAMPVDQFVASGRNVRYVLYRVLAPATDVSVSTTVGGDLEIPITGTITEIGAWVDTAGTTGTMTVDVNKGGTTLMTTTKISINSAQKSSRTATAPVLTTTAISAGDLITVDIDAIHTTPAKGLTVRLGIRLT